MFSNLIQNTPDWHAFRKTKIGSSDAPVICGVSPFKTPYRLWLEKMGKIEPPKFTYAMERGSRLEPRAIELLSDETDEVLSSRVFTIGKEERFIASVDAINFEGSKIYEIKCPLEKTWRLFRDEGVIPEYWLYQMQFQLFVSGFQSITLVVYGEENDEETIHTLEIKRDSAMIEKIVAKCEEFYEWMQSGVYPAEIEDHVLNESPEFANVAFSYKTAYQAFKQAEAKLEEAKATLLDETDGGNMFNDSVRITYVKKQGNVDYKKLLEKLNLSTEYCEEFRKESVVYPKITLSP